MVKTPLNRSVWDAWNARQTKADLDCVTAFAPILKAEAELARAKPTVGRWPPRLRSKRTQYLARAALTSPRYGVREKTWLVTP